MERITDIGTLLSRFQDGKEERMITRFHGIDRHKKFSTVSVLDRDGKEVRFLRSCSLEDYLSDLGAEDAVLLEASCGCFYWADRIEATGASCYVLDPRRFRIITDSWNKTDRQDARNMAKALWVFLVTGEFGIPTVYKPSVTIRTLRRLFATYNLLNRQIRMLKNAIQAMLTDDGVVLTSSQLSQLFAGRAPVAEILSEHSLSPTIVSAIEIQAALLRQVNESKDALARQIVIHSAPLADQITLLVTIPGITPLTAAAFLADIGDVRRFKSLRQMNAYLGLVPRCHDSGGKSRPGHITRESRKLTRTILTQSIYQAVKSTPSWQRNYDELKARRGAGRARIAMIRRLCGVMRRMLLNGEKYHWLKEDLYRRKLQQYRQALESAKKEQNAA
jgi:transposase